MVVKYEGELFGRVVGMEEVDFGEMQRTQMELSRASAKGEIFCVLYLI